MAEEKKPAAKKPAAAKPAAAKKPAAEKKPAAKTAAKPAATKKPAAYKPAKASELATEKPATAAKVEKVEKVVKLERQAKSKKKKAEPADKSPILKLHHLRPAPGSKKDRIRVGRGEASKGKTSGRGTKGTKARYQVRPGFEGGGVRLVMRTPKLRGFKNPFRIEYQVVNLEKLAEHFPQGGAVTIADLVNKGLVRSNEPVKVLGSGDISVKLDIKVDKVSEQAKSKILAAGGSVSK
ncbi:MAG: 50S ribosomal protein L15 [Micrococcales bacterium]|nr:50S ribosomal protein L15 [Micrococcales bacterium]